MRIIAPLLTLLMACGPGIESADDDDTVDASAHPDGWTPDEFADAAPAEPCENIDFLFVIDNSGSMAEEQSNLATNFPGFIDVIENYEVEGGGFIDYRVAATTTGRDVSYTIDLPDPFEDLPMSEAGENGALLLGDGCNMPRRWLERSDGDVATKFSCVAEVGTGGPSLEMPLYTTELAFTDRVADGTNAGFLRDDALLALVVLTDEDDCSRTDNNFTIENDQCDPPGPNVVELSYYQSFLDNLKGAHGRWAMAVIAGPGPGTCESSFGEAYEATRLKQFVDMTGDTAVFSSICAGDLTTALGEAIDTFQAACESFPPIP